MFLVIFVTLKLTFSLFVYFFLLKKSYSYVKSIKSKENELKIVKYETKRKRNVSNYKRCRRKKRVKIIENLENNQNNELEKLRWKWILSRTTNIKGTLIFTPKEITKRVHTQRFSIDQYNILKSKTGWTTGFLVDWSAMVKFTGLYTQINVYIHVKNKQNNILKKRIIFFFCCKLHINILKILLLYFLVNY